MGSNSLQSFVITVTLLTLIEWTAISPFKTFGFYCNDPKLEFKYDGETVKLNLLLFVTFVLPYFVFMIVEWFLKNDISSNPPIKNSWIRNGHHWYLTYLHGAFFNYLITDILKIIAGEPRPHFFDTCKPVEAVNCTNGQYFPEFTCTNTSQPFQMHDSYKSFPSGHASFSFYTSTFLFMYFSAKVKTNSFFLLNLLHVTCISWALTSSITRITDHRHHWWDVLVGSIFGIAVSLFFYFNLWGHRRSKKFETEKNNSFESKFMNSD